MIRGQIRGVCWRIFEMQNEQLSKQSLLPLKTLLQMGKYRVDRYLSSGGFGNTYVITNLQFEEQFAMKEFFMTGINERNSDNTTISVSNKTNRPLFEQQREKFKKEARRLRKLSNENGGNGHIVKVHDLFDENGTSYYVMDFVDGESLSNRMKRTGKPIKEQEALNILEQVLDALEIVHSKGIWHLDLKPGNIMVDKSGTAKLIDFGASKQMSSTEGYATTTTSMCYTPGYAPTEQIDQNIELIGSWTDLYALGATLYYMLTKHQPPTVSEMFSPNAFSFDSSVSKKTRYLIRWMMSHNRKERPQSVKDVREFLEKPFIESVSEPKGVSKEEEVTVMGAAPVQKDEKSKPSINKWIPLAIIGGILCLGIIIFSVMMGNGNQIVKPSSEAIIQRLINNMVYVEGGTFTMGATSEQENDADDNGKPTHRVTLSSFSIGKYEVTQEEWQAVMGDNPSRRKGAKRPVERVSWNNCQEFIRKLNAMTGKRFRLPTEAEWEYAARGGNRSIGYNYSGSDNLDRVAWYDSNSGNTSHDVGQKSPNEIGLYDMSGNVMELCQDWYGSYDINSQTNPSGPSSGDGRVCRGGSWFSGAGRCRVSHRSILYSGYWDYEVGLRLAL